MSTTNQSILMYMGWVIMHEPCMAVKIGKSKVRAFIFDQPCMTGHRLNLLHVWHPLCNNPLCGRNKLNYIVGSGHMFLVTNVNIIYFIFADLNRCFYFQLLSIYYTNTFSISLWFLLTVFSVGPGLLCSNFYLLCFWAVLIMLNIMYLPK